MTRVFHQFHIPILTGSIFLFLGVAAYAQTIQGNGANSNNSITVTSPCQASISQTNTSTLNNSAASQQNTGNNSASGNTGQSSGISTGNSSSSTTINNAGNVNSAFITPCPTTVSVNVVTPIPTGQSGGSSSGAVTPTPTSGGGSTSGATPTPTPTGQAAGVSSVTTTPTPTSTPSRVLGISATSGSPLENILGFLGVGSALAGTLFLNKAKKISLP